MLQALLKTTLQVRYRITGQFPISHSLIKASRDVCYVFIAMLSFSEYLPVESEKEPPFSFK